MFHVKKVVKKVGKLQHYIYLCNVLKKSVYIQSYLIECVYFVGRGVIAALFFMSVSL